MNDRSSWSWPPLEKEQRETSRISSWTLTRFLEEGEVQVLGSRSARDQPRDALIPLSQRRRRPRAAATAARAQAAAELKPAPWAAAIEGINQKKGWNGAIDKTGLEDCPVCLEEKADVKMDPCGHTC